MSSRSTGTPNIIAIFPSTSKAKEQSIDKGNETDNKTSDKVLHPYFDGHYFKIKKKATKEVHNAFAFDCYALRVVCIKKA